MSFFGGKSENGTANSTESESSPDGTGPGPITEEKGEAANETSPEPASKKTEIKTERVALNLTVTAAGIVPMDQPAKAKALTK